MSGPSTVPAADAAALMRAVIARIATGPELSKDLSREQAHLAMRSVLDGAVDPVQAAVFLIALRMKRETDDENLGVLDALLEATHTVTAPVAELADLADPYDGFCRTLPASPFLPAVLSACGLPAVVHGVASMGPKHGVTHRQVLAAAGLPVDLAPEEAAERLADPAIGWAYVDQKSFCPKLYALVQLRDLIVKRPLLTTLEVLLGPIRARGRTHLVTGFVHKNYPRIYALLARSAGFDSALIVRGVEGGVIASLRQTGRAFAYYDRGAEQSIEFDASQIGAGSSAPAPVAISARRAAQIEDADASGEAVSESGQDAPAMRAAQAGLSALSGEPGPTREALVCGAGLALWHLRRSASLPAACAAVRQVLDDGTALDKMLRNA